MNESDQLVTFDSALPGDIASARPITGLAAGNTVVGIDFRPIDGRLYALGQQDRRYTIAPATGVATQVGTAPFGSAIVGAEPGFDISAASDRIRIVSNIDENLRLNPDTGVAIDADPITEGPQPDTPLDTPGTVTAIAYTNSFPGATATTLFGIDTTANTLVMIGGDGGEPATRCGAGPASTAPRSTRGTAAGRSSASPASSADGGPPAGHARRRPRPGGGPTCCSRTGSR